MTTTKAYLIILEYNYKFGKRNSLIFKPKDANYAVVFTCLACSDVYLTEASAAAHNWISKLWNGL